MRIFPLAGDTDNDTTYDHEAEEAPSAGPPVSSSEIQTHVPSFFEPTPASAAGRKGMNTVRRGPKSV